MNACKRFLLSGILLLLLPACLAFGQESSTYTVKSGDTLFRIARSHGLTVDALKALNNLTDNTIQPGQELIVSAQPSVRVSEELPDPVFEPATEEAPTEEAAPPLSPGEAVQPAEQSRYKPTTRARRSYTIQPGDTYYTIALEHGIPAYAIFAMNGGNTAPLVPYESIWIPDTDPISSYSESDEPQTYTVRQGDTLYGIARKSRSNVQRLKSFNDLPNNALSIGQVIKIPPPDPQRRPKNQQLPPLYESGPVDIYPETYAGRITASGMPYDPERYTVSHPELALETIVLLTNPETGHRTFAEVTDRGPLDTRYIMDVSAIVARELRLTDGINQPVQIRVVE